jgi:hypothetical protein
MSARKPTTRAKPLREWWITLIRKKRQYVGRVEAPDALERRMRER